MKDFYDTLETRDPAEREQDLIRKVSDQVSHAMANTTAYAEILAGADPVLIASVARRSSIRPRTKAMSFIQESS